MRFQKTSALLFSFLNALFVGAVSADDIICAHGHSGTFQTPSKEPSNSFRFGWGISYLVPIPGQYEPCVHDWIHYSIPVNVNDKFRQAVIIYYSGYQAHLDSVHVSSGPNSIKSFDGRDFGWLENGWRFERLDLVDDLAKPGVEFNLGAGGVSILPGACQGGEERNRLTIGAVCLLK